MAVYSDFTALLAVLGEWSSVWGWMERSRAGRGLRRGAESVRRPLTPTRARGKECRVASRKQLKPCELSYT